VKEKKSKVVTVARPCNSDLAAKMQSVEKSKKRPGQTLEEGKGVTPGVDDLLGRQLRQEGDETLSQRAKQGAFPIYLNEHDLKDEGEKVRIELRKRTSKPRTDDGDQKLR